MMKTYRELTLGERRKTYQNYMDNMDEKTKKALFDTSFEAYNEENEFLDLDFDAESLECLG